MKVICAPVNGFFNRLRCVASCYILAQQSNKDFQIMWEPFSAGQGHEPCGIKLEEVIDCPWITPLDFDWNNIRWANCEPNHTIIEGDRLYIQYNETSRGQEICDTDFSEVVVLGGGNIINPVYSLSQFNDLKREFYKALRFKPELLRVASQIWKPHENEKVLGVQVRGTDHKTRHGFKGSAEDLYYHVLNPILDQFKGYDSIYITSDESVIVKKVLSNPDLTPSFTGASGHVSRNSLSGMTKSIIDWICLSKCNKILHSYDSSFGEEAAILNNSPSLVLNYK